MCHFWLYPGCTSGSKSTIAPLLRQWKAQHQGETVAVGAGLPVDLLEAVKASTNACTPTRLALVQDNAVFKDRRLASAVVAKNAEKSKI